MNTNEDIVRQAYKVAEQPTDIDKFISLFAADGYINNTAAGKIYRGEEMGDLIREVSKAFPDIHRELGNFYFDGNVVIVELALQGTHTGLLETPEGPKQATGKRVDVPCCDVWTVKDGKIQSFHCYLAATIMYSQVAQ